MGGPHASFVPPGRLGALLAHRRTRWGMSLDHMARRSGRFGPVDLAHVERGRLHLEHEDVHALGLAYGIDVGRATPRRGRLIMDLDERAPAAMAGVTAVEVLARYVVLVATLRDGFGDGPVSFRGADLVVLAATLRMDVATVSLQVEAHAEAVLDGTTASLDNVVWAVDAGLLIGPGEVGSVVLVEFPQRHVPALLGRLSWPATSIAPTVPPPSGAQRRGRPIASPR